jgi:hypothetical protein
MNTRVKVTGQEDPPKLLYAGDNWHGESQPHVVIASDSLRFMGDLDKGITLDAQFGTTVQGPLSLAEMPENIHIASYWALVATVDELLLPNPDLKSRR